MKKTIKERAGKMGEGCEVEYELNDAKQMLLKSITFDGAVLLIPGEHIVIHPNIKGGVSITIIPPEERYP